MLRPLNALFLLIAAPLLLGCASSQPTIYPAQTQADAVELTTRSGYDFLRSEQGGTVVTMSLRAATRSYVQAYVSVSNQGENSVTVDPTSVTVVAKNGRQMTFPAYAPGDVPGIVQRSAQSSSEFVESMGDFKTMTSSEMTGEAQKGGSRGGYGADADEGTSYMDLMLKEQVLGSRNAASGLVYTPFNREFKTFRIEIPLGNTTHTFRFEITSGDA
jgi:hypothetical protein